MLFLLLILLSAGLHALPFPPWDLGFVAWVALVPLLHVLSRVRPGVAVLAGLLWGHTTHWALAYWVPAALTTYYGQAWWFGITFAAVTSPVFWCIYFAAFAGGACLIMRRYQGVARALLIAAVWVACEIARARLLTGAPWLLLGYSQLANPALIQAADSGGPYILSFAVAFVNIAIFEVARALPRGLPAYRRSAVRRRIGVAGSAIFLVAALFTYGRYRLSATPAAAPQVPIAVIQGNNVAGAHWQPGFYGHGFEDYLRLSARAVEQFKPRLIVWPEAAVTMFLAHEPQFLVPITRLLQANDADLIVGAPHYYGDDDPARPAYFNSAFHLTAEGQISGRFDKVHLLPFVEYFPLRSIELLRRRFERVRTFTPGQKPTLLDTRFGKVAVAICFEAIFPEIVRERMALGAGLLVVLSNDIWLGTAAGPLQHFAMARLRAVENRTWVIRATTTGVSALIDPFGRVHSVSPSFAPAILAGFVTFQQTPTIYQQVGDLFAYACALAVAVALIARARYDISRRAMAPEVGEV